MTPRQIRRAAERKANKSQRARLRAGTSETNTPEIASASSTPNPFCESSENARKALNITPREITQTCVNLELETAPANEFAAAVPPAAISEAQLTANRTNAQSSTGPTSQPGKAISSQNRRSHGLTGKFQLLHSESPAEFQDLEQSLLNEHQPTTDSEHRLIHSMLQHYWLMQRALHLQNELLLDDELDQKLFSLYLRYQTTNERSYYRAIRELATLRKEHRQQQNGFESQKRQQELNDAKVRLTNARAAASEIETEVKSTMEAPLPGNIRIPFEDLTAAFRVTLQNLNRELTAELTQNAAA